MAGPYGVSDDFRQQRHEVHIQQTYKDFIKDVCAMGNFSEEFAVRAASSVMCRLEQRILPKEAMDLEAQLPAKFVALILHCSSERADKPVEKFDRQGFIERVASDLGKSNEEAETIARAVFAAVRARISEGEADDVTAQLPKDLKSLWARPV